MKNTITLLFCLLVYFTSLRAQDVITKKDGKKLEVIIKKVTRNTVEYYNFNDPKKVVFTLDKFLIKDLQFSYGEKLDVKNPEKNPLYFYEDKINNVMFNFLAFNSNSLILSYEKNTGFGQSILLDMKLYGLGTKPEDEISRSGFGLDVSYRFKTKSFFNKDSFRPNHMLEGSYFAPIAGFSNGSLVFDDGYLNPKRKEISHSIFHFGLQYGHQWIIQRLISIDASIGFHYYFGDDGLDTYEYDSLDLGNMSGQNGNLFSFNLRIGFLVGKKTFYKID